MKSIRNSFVNLFVLGGFVALFSLLHAQGTATLTHDSEISLATNDVSAMSDLEVEEQAVEMTTPIAATNESLDGTFYSAQNPDMAPSPEDVLGVPVWPIGDGFFLLDDRNVDYDALQTASQSKSKMRAMGLSSLSDFGDDLSPDFTSLDLVSSTNLWLAITNLTDNTAGLLLSNTEADIEYEIQGATNLTGTNWISEGFVLGSELTNWTPTSVSATNHPTLFLRVRSWQDSDGNGLPIWWQQQYFGTTGVDPNAQDPSGDGWDYLQDFNNGFIPGTFNTPPLPPETNAPPLICSIVPGLEGSVVLAVASMPANTITLRLMRIDVIAHQYGDFSFDSNFDISVTTNGLYSLANIPSPPDVYLPNFAPSDIWYVKALGTNGDLSAMSVVSQLSDQFVNYQNGSENAWLVPPYFDGRAQLKQNLIFQLRAADAVAPFQINDSVDLSTIFTVYYPSNYVYAGFYSVNNYNQVYGLQSDSPTLQVSLPFDDNYMYRNYIFNSADVDVYGDLNSILFLYEDYYYSYSPILQLPPVFQFQFTQTNGATISSLLSTNDTQWLCLFPILFDGIDQDASIGFSDSSLEGGGKLWTLSSGVRNYWGLPFVSAKVYYYDDDVDLMNTVVNAGNSFTDIYNLGASVYMETKQPQFQTAEYDFWNAPLSFSQYSGTNPIPGMTNFSTGRTSDLLITSVGNPNFNIVGYAKLSVQNGYSGVYGYLGQYFDQAYQMTNGVVTTNTTGVVSPYGGFFATQPGQTALVTMPDVDTGERGTATVYVVGLQLDANHDGNMDLNFSGTDNTSQGNPDEVWVNDGYILPGNGGSLDQDLPLPLNNPINANSAAGKITCPRDLENFFRLWVCGMPALPSAQGYYVTLTCSAVSGSPAINLYYAETNGGTLYLTDTNTALSLVSEGTLGTISPTSPYVFAPDFFDGTNKYFMFEGAGIGEGQFTLTIYQGANVIAQTSTYIDLHDVKDFFEQDVIQESMSGAKSNWTSSVEMVQPAIASGSGNDTNMIVLVHGINVRPWDCIDDAGTVCKRLYWAGFQGKFAEVEWPCNLITPIPSPLTFDVFNLSELQAYKASTALTTCLNGLKARFPNYRLNILAHSQGNAVVSEAIKNGAPFDTYILTQGAMPDSCYDVDAPTYAPFVAQETGTAITPESQPMGYRGIYTNLTGRIVNFYNPNDPVLAIWNQDQINVKPSTYYSFDGTNCWYTDFFFISHLVTDPQEARAMVSRSRTLSIGQSGPESGHGVIQSAVDLNAQFGFNKAFPDDHSAQWTWPIQKCWGYYDQILESCLIPTIQR